jgi:hypothetical protein
MPWVIFLSVETFLRKVSYRLTLRKKALTERKNERQSTADYSSPNSQGVGFRRNLCILPFIFSLR